MDLRTPQSDGPLRIGAVSYLNSKPLVYGLADALRGHRLTCDLPSRLAADLVAERLDVALIPIVEYLRHPEFSLVSDACVACGGPVLSVKVFFRRPPAEVRTLALDEGSRTSAALAQVLLGELHDVAPRLEPLPIGAGLAQTTADAVLLIGDRAMHPQREAFAQVWDLGDRWCRWAELPFVFAAWIARPGVELGNLASVLEQTRDRGVAKTQAIAEREAGPLGLSPEVAHEYLTRNLHFTLGPQERRGMEKFADLCRSRGLLQAPQSSCKIKAEVQPMR